MLSVSLWKDLLQSFLLGGAVMRFMSIKISVAALWYLPWKVGLTRSGSGRGHWRVLEVLDDDHDGKNGGEGTEVPGRSPSKEMTLE